MPRPRRILPSTRSFWLASLIAAGVVAASVGIAHLVRRGDNGTGLNPHPAPLQRPVSAPLSTVALLGKQIFYDRSLSGSGLVACASCHSPTAAYGPATGQLAAGEVALPAVVGTRAVPSLRYADRVPNFSIGPESGDAENVDNNQIATQTKGAVRPKKLAGAVASTPTMVPEGGLFWDGRVNTLQDQAMGPLFNPVEMGNHDAASVAAALRKAPYSAQFTELFGAQIFQTPSRVVDEAMFAVARYQLEDSSFHPYTSKYDYYLEGNATLTPAERRGLALFEDKARANCAGCHLDQPSPDGQPPAFTDYQFEALGVPRNGAIAANHDPKYFDLGLCGPVRKDMTAQTQYCGMFRTPSLRNAATRTVFFHNGVYKSLDEVVAFYNNRDVHPDRVYPRASGGEVAMFDDMPSADRANIDVADPPFNRKRGDQAPMTDEEMRDILAFLHTLTDGYRPAGRIGGDRPSPPPR